MGKLLYKDLQQSTHAQTAEVADGSAKDAHQNTDTGEACVVSGSYDGSGSGAADVSQGCSGDHAQIPLEQLGQDEHQNDMDSQDHEAVDDPHGQGPNILK